MADGVHPSKCEHLQFTNKHNFIDTTLHIIWPHHHNKSLVLDKYLGFTFDCHLSWKNHISTITAKANAAKAFLRRNTTFCPTEVKIHCYKTFVRPTMEYSVTVWSPHTAHDMSKFESILCRSARYVFNDYSSFHSISAMLNQLT